MRRPLVAVAIALLAITPTMLTAQRSTDLIQQARARLSAHDLDSAGMLLTAAMTRATGRADSVNVYTWRAALFFMRGDDSATRVAFDQALQLDSTLQVPALALASPRLPSVLEEERVALRPDIVYTSSDVDEKPRRVSGPPVVYPPELLRRQVRGRAVVGLIIDTLGRAEEHSIDIVATPDSGMNSAIRTMILGATFAPGRRHGKKVRTLTELAIDLVPGAPPSATSLVTSARALIAAHQTDSALALLRDALDPATQPTEGERVYALLARGNAWHEAGRDSLARLDYDTALASYQRLTARGVELAPFLKRLADSVRLALPSSTGTGAFGRPSAASAVDAAPEPLSHPAIRYPPEMQALRVGGTVTVEATVDATGRVVPGSVKVLQSPNPGLDAEAIRVVTASRYRPARRGGRPVSTTVRQAITFTPY